MDVGEIVPNHSESLVDSCENSMAPKQSTIGVKGGDSSRREACRSRTLDRIFACDGRDGTIIGAGDDVLRNAIKRNQLTRALKQSTSGVRGGDSSRAEVKHVGGGPSTDSPGLEQQDILHRFASDGRNRIILRDVDELRNAINCNQLSRVVHLEFQGGDIGNGNVTVAEVLASGKMSSLRQLRMWETGLMGDTCEAICNALTSGKCPSLTSIDFGVNEIDSKGVEALCRAIESCNLVKLEYLRLGSTGIDDNGMVTLATAFQSGKSSALPNLKGLFLHRNSFTELGMQQLGEALKSGRLKSLEKLNLWGNKLGDVGMEHLAKALQHGNTIILPNLKMLDVSKNSFTVVGLRHLVNGLKSGRLDSLEFLQLEGCDLFAESGDILASAFIENRNLTPWVKPTFNGRHERLRERNKRLKDILNGLASSPMVPATSGKVYLCGNPEVGKTTLSHSLQRSFLQSMWTREKKPHQEERTRGIDVAQISSKGTKRKPDANPITLHLWDMAGQEEYHLVHHSFFADLDEAKATTFVVVCTSEDLDKSEEQLKYWLRFIASGCDTTTQSLRHVFVVLNNKVQNGRQEGQVVNGHAERWQKVLKSEREKFTGLLEVESHLFWIDVRARESVVGFKKCLLQHSRNVLSKKHVPQLCEDLQKYLAKLTETRKQFPVLHWEEFVENLVQEPSFFKWSTEEIQAGVKYLNQVGVLIDVDKRSTEDWGIPYSRLLVLDPNWICKKVIGNMLLSQDMVSKTEREDLFRDQVNKTTGAVSIPNVKRFFHSLLGEWNDLQFDDLISILLWLGLCYKGRDGNVYIPSLIDEKAELADAWQPSSFQEHVRDTWVMGFSVEREESDKTLAPMSLWHKFQVGLAQTQKFNGVLGNFFTVGKTFVTFTVDLMDVLIEVDAREDIPTFDEITIFVKPVPTDQWDVDIRRQSQVDLAHDLLNILLLEWDIICPTVKYVCKVVWPWPASRSRPKHHEKTVLQVTELKGLVQEKGVGTHQLGYCTITCDQLLSTNDKKDLMKAVQNVVHSKISILKEAMTEAVGLGIYPQESKVSQITLDAVGVPFQLTGVSNNGVSAEESDLTSYQIGKASHNMSQTEEILQAIQALENSLMREAREARREVIDKVDKVSIHLNEIKNMIQEGLSKVLSKQEKVFGKLQETQRFLIEEKDRTCPNLIYLGEEGSGQWAKLKQVLSSSVTVTVRLQFACEAMYSSYEPHKVKNQQGIQVSALHPVLKKIAPWLKVSLTIFLTSAKIAANVVIPGFGMILPDMLQLQRATSLLDGIVWATGFSNDELDKLMRDGIGFDASDAGWNPRYMYGRSRAAITELIGNLKTGDYEEKFGLRKVCLKYRDGSLHGIAWICTDCLQKFRESNLVTEV